MCRNNRREPPPPIKKEMTSTKRIAIAFSTEVSQPQNTPSSQWAKTDLERYSLILQIQRRLISIYTLAKMPQIQDRLRKSAEHTKPTTYKQPPPTIQATV